MTSGISVFLTSVYFPSAGNDQNTGYAVGHQGTILKTIDGGGSWLQQASGTTKDLYSTYFIDNNTGFAVGRDGTILKTTNGGETWITKYSGTSFWLGGIYFYNEVTGYAFGQGGVILKSTDGGTTWVTQAQSNVNDPELLSVFFTSPDTGYAVGGLYLGAYNSSVILKTTDGGTNWSKVYGEVSYVNLILLYSVHFTNANTGYVVGGYGQILKTTDRGATWVSENSGVTQNLYSVHFPLHNTGYAVGDMGTILKTIDAGSKWEQQDPVTSSNLFSVFFTSENIGYAVGDSGTILKTVNGGGYPTGVNENLLSYSLKTYPNPSSDNITIETTEPASQCYLSILNLNGQQLITCKITSSKTQINISNLASGVYILRLTNPNTVLTGKIVKQ